MAAVDIEPETLADIMRLAEFSHEPCSCEHRGGRWFLCQYHDGYDAAISAVKESAS